MMQHIGIVACSAEGTKYLMEGPVYPRKLAASASNAKRPRMYCLRPSEKGFDVIWSAESECELDWASPAIGPDGGI